MLDKKVKNCFLLLFFYIIYNYSRGIIFYFGEKIDIGLSKGIAAIRLVSVIETVFLFRSCVSNPIEFEVVSKEVKTEKRGKSFHYIFTKNDKAAEVFQNSDNWLKDKFASLNLYKKLEVGKTL